MLAEVSILRFGLVLPLPWRKGLDDSCFLLGVGVFEVRQVADQWISSRLARFE